jgi:hypothetical protein
MKLHQVATNFASDEEARNSGDEQHMENTCG